MAVLIPRLQRFQKPTSNMKANTEAVFSVVVANEAIQNRPTASHFSGAFYLQPAHRFKPKQYCKLHFQCHLPVIQRRHGGIINHYSDVLTANV